MKKVIPLLVLPLLLVTATSLLSAETLPREELAKKKKYLMSFDANGDQALSESEYIEMVRTQFAKNGQSGHEQVGKKRFKFRDLDKDGKVTFEEWVAKQQAMQ